MIKKIVLIFVILGFLLGGYWYYQKNNRTGLINPLKSVENIVSKKEIPSPVMTKNVGYLAQYNFENLRDRKYEASEIKSLGGTMLVDEARKELIKRGDLEGKSFDFETKAISFESGGKKISGMMNIPLTPKSNKIPAIIMLRGFAESQGYYIGSGSWRAADELARNGFITVSLDFLGFGQSDGEAKDILEARFVKPINVMDLIESVKKIDIVDQTKIGIWAHSNGGQIALSVLEISGQNYPTVLWAPMTNPFPQSVLETTDGNNKVRKRIEEFEKEYDSKLYSIDNYYEWIESPILLHQGTEDVWCKVEWQKDLKDKLKKMGKDITLDIVSGADHNLKQSWDEVAAKDVKFFKEKFQL